MGQEERIPHTPTEHERIRRAFLPEEEPHPRLELPSPPPTWIPEPEHPGSTRRSQRHARSPRRRSIAVAGLIGLVLGIVATLFATRAITDLLARIGEFDRAQAMRREAAAQVAELDGREAALDQRSAELHSREATLAGRETILIGRERELREREQELVQRDATPARRGRELARREATSGRHSPLPGINLSGGNLGHFGRRVQGLINKVTPGR